MIGVVARESVTNNEQSNNCFKIKEDQIGILALPFITSPSVFRLDYLSFSYCFSGVPYILRT